MKRLIMLPFTAAIALACATGFAYAEEAVEQEVAADDVVASEQGLVEQNAVEEADEAVVAQEAAADEADAAVQPLSNTFDGCSFYVEGGPFYFTGNPETPIISVEGPGGEELVNGKDFEVEYSMDLGPGDVYYRVIGLGSYEGASYEGYFYVIPTGTYPWDAIELENGKWLKNSKGWWYRYDTSGWACGIFASENGKIYYFNDAGYMITGWQTLNYSGNDYMILEGGDIYFASNGAMQFRWSKIGGKWFYFDWPTGVLQYDWLRIDSNWYYIDYYKGMQVGWQKIGGKWYYFNKSGVMKTGWLKSGSNWYYLKSSGAMVTGWYQVGSKWYYFNSSGVMQAGKWVGDYYLTSSGAMATDTWVGNYYVGPDGKWDRSKTK